MLSRLRKTADLNAPGALDDLLAFHRAAFGDARMQGEEGGEESADDAGDGDADDDADVTDEERAALADPGKQALDRISAKHKTERDRRKALEQEIATLRAQKPADGKGGDETPDLDALKAEAKAAAAAELQRERLLDKIEAKAARVFVDPDDAAALLLRTGDIDDFLDADGKIDVEAIEDGLKALLEKKPYLGVAQGDGKRFKGGADGGARKESKPKVTSLQDAVAARITAGGS